LVIQTFVIKNLKRGTPFLNFTLDRFTTKIMKNLRIKNIIQKVGLKSLSHPG